MSRNPGEGKGRGRRSVSLAQVQIFFLDSTWSFLMLFTIPSLLLVVASEMAILFAYPYPFLLFSPAQIGSPFFNFFSSSKIHLMLIRLVTLYPSFEKGAPSLAKVNAHILPIPKAPPVTRAILFCNPPIIFILNPTEHGKHPNL